MTADVIDRAAMEVCLRERSKGKAEQREQWRREADEIRAVCMALPKAPDEPEATELLTTMLKAEDRGIARWDERSKDWCRIRPATKRTNGDGPRRSWRTMTTGDLRRFEKLRQVGPDRWTARCPAHEDRTPSLSIRRGRDWWSLHCWTGCDYWDIVKAAGLSDVDLRVKQ